MSVTPLHSPKLAPSRTPTTESTNGQAPRPDAPLSVNAPPVRNPGFPLDLALVRTLRVNRSAVERRALTLPARRTVKKEWQAAWLLRAVSCMDLTTLAGDDTPGNVRRLCAKARSPVRSDVLAALGVGDL